MDDARRRWIKHIAFLSAAAVLTGWDRLRAAMPPERQARCDDTSGLTPEDIKRRKELKYTDRASNREQTCGGCMHLQPVPGSNSPCKRCSVLPGPVHADGWCSAWVARVSGSG